MSELYEDSVELYQDQLIPTGYVAQMAQLAENTRVQMTTGLLYEDVSLTDRAIENLESIQQLLTLYEGTNTQTEEAAALTRFADNWALFDERVRINRELFIAGNIEGVREGIAIGAPLFRVAREDLLELIAVNERLAAELVEQNEQMYQVSRMTMLIGGFLATGLAVAITLILSKYLLKTIQTVNGRLQEVAEGNLSGEDLHLQTKDEFATLADGVNSMQHSLQRLVTETVEATQQVSASSEQLSASAEQSTHAADQLAALAQQSAEGSDQQLNSLNDVSSAVEQMAASIHQIAQNSAEMSAYSEEAVSQTQSGTEAIERVDEQMLSISNAVSETSQSVERLGAKSVEIGNIVKLITGIAEQTNLLALNAAIEAARAGEHGKGFAVVADEVRKLAEESKQSAAQIYDMITEIQTETNSVITSMQGGAERVQEGLETTSNVTSTFAEIKEAIESVTVKVQEVSASVQEMASVSDHVVHSIETIKTVAEMSVVSSQESSAASQEQLATMEEITAASTSLAELAEGLQQSISKFRV